jgi:Fur family ferric uptake transcriptional regulator
VISVDVDVAADFVSRLGADHDFVPDLGHLTVFGRCQECSG